MSGLRTMRTVWIRPSTTSTVSTLQTRISACCSGTAESFGRRRVSGALHERGELLRVDVAGLQERQRLLGREPLGLPELLLGRASQQAAGLAVDPHPPALELAGARAHLSHGGHEARDERGAEERLLRRHRLAAAVGVQDGVLGEQLLQGLQVALLGGREEPFEQGVAGGLVGVEARAAGLEMLARPRHELPRVHLGPLDDAGDLRVLVPEHLAQQVGRPLDRGQPLQEHQQGQRQRIRELGARRRARAPGPRPAAPAATARHRTRDGPAPTCRTLIESRVTTVVIQAAGSSIGPSWRVRRRSASWATSSASETLPSIR